MSGDVLKESYRAVKSRVAAMFAGQGNAFRGTARKPAADPKRPSARANADASRGQKRAKRSAPCPPYGVRRNVTSSLAISYSNFLQV